MLHSQPETLFVHGVFDMGSAVPDYELEASLASQMSIFYRRIDVSDSSYMTCSYGVEKQVPRNSKLTISITQCNPAPAIPRLSDPIFSPELSVYSLMALDSLLRLSNSKMSVFWCHTDIYFNEYGHGESPSSSGRIEQITWISH
jgi:hypothetical protein